jgi:hypothetical protein
MEMHVHLKASNGRYCSVGEGGKGANGGSRILASAEAAQGWETFYLTRLNGPAFGPPLQLQSGDRVRLSSLRGHHLFLSGIEVRAGKAEPADATVFIVERATGAPARSSTAMRSICTRRRRPAGTCAPRPAPKASLVTRG